MDPWCLQIGSAIKFVAFHRHILLQMKKLSVLNTGLYFGAFLIYSLREEDWGGSIEQSASNTTLHLKIDFVMFFLHGIIAFCFPGTIATFQV